MAIPRQVRVYMLLPKLSRSIFYNYVSSHNFFSLLLITQCILIFSDLIRLLEYPKPFLVPLRLSEPPVVQTFDALVIGSC